MNDWVEKLYRELDAWNYDGVAATLWWRDDDAQAPSAELERLLDLAQRYDAPLALAVIPDGVDGALAARVETSPTVTVLQHGFAHANHAPPNEKKNELGDHRPTAVVHQELTRGHKILRDVFGEKFLPVLVPPWNRIAASVADHLAQTGFTGLSTFGARAARESAGVTVVNTHVDLIDWKHGRGFVGAARATDAIVAHLNDRRHGRVDAAEPTGLLTHHLVHDDACEKFLSRLFAATDEHPAARWLRADTVFAGR